MTWELKGKYPKIFEDAVVGDKRKSCTTTPTDCSTRSSQTSCLTANAVYGFWPAASDGDDVIVYTDEQRNEELARFHCLRQQWERKGQKDYRSLADYIAPVDSGREDYVGGFVVTAGVGAEELVRAVQSRSR